MSESMNQPTEVVSQLTKSCEQANFSVSGSQESVSGGLVGKPMRCHILPFLEILHYEFGVSNFFFSGPGPPSPLSILCSGFSSHHSLDLEHLSDRDLCCATFDGRLYQSILPNMVQTVPREGPLF